MVFCASGGDLDRQMGRSQKADKDSLLDNVPRRDTGVLSRRFIYAFSFAVFGAILAGRAFLETASDVNCSIFSILTSALKKIRKSVVFFRLFLALLHARRYNNSGQLFRRARLCAASVGMTGNI